MPVSMEPPGYKLQTTENGSRPIWLYIYDADLADVVTPATITINSVSFDNIPFVNGPQVYKQGDKHLAIQVWYAGITPITQLPLLKGFDVLYTKTRPGTPLETGTLTLEAWLLP